MSSKKKADISAQQDARKARLAEQLRANLQRRKVQARARRTGEADDRPEGIAAAKEEDRR
ncbi:hypothetical protein EET67_04865 [Pseudaminobacter arsenicus]|uniref:Uncharacterized protein n=1 Tax=Borborobacter arsenicus TaxID=1851146 RepID=A0A432VA22_9HYPH|nr:hypothetical protein [Pseudaminobacter arsenicus]RUM98976.1 hypothetical protein EET67_04865 [Pseudaminobacter arsenicus]